MELDDLTGRVIKYADDVMAPEVPVKTGIDGFTVSRRCTLTGIAPQIYVPIACLVLQGQKESWMGSERVPFGKGQAVIVSHDVPAMWRVTQASSRVPYVALALEIDVGLLRSLSGELGEEGLSEARARPMASDAATAELVDSMGRMFELVGKPLHQKALLPHLRREIHFHLLIARNGGMLRQLAVSDSTASRIARALSCIRNEFDKPLRVGQLAGIAGMSLSSFHEHFKAFTATSPLQYQKELRLIEARRRIASGEDSISGIAYGVGYESPTQFSREYARKFSTAPRADRQRLTA